MDVWWVETGLLDGVFELDGNVDEVLAIWELDCQQRSLGIEGLWETCFDR